MNELKNLLFHKTSISDSDWEILKQVLQEKSVEKNDFLLEAGKVERQIYFIKEGVFRIYLELPEKDITIDFGFPNELICSYSSLLTEKPSQVYVQSLSKSEVISITYKDLQEIYKTTDSGESIGRVFAEEFFLYKSAREFSFMKDSPTERYLNLFSEQPHLIQEIPQKYLASYIGITPQALSRIRAKL